jgi:DNA gyrase/topoisomerase IV subunit A
MDTESTACPSIKTAKFLLNGSAGIPSEWQPIFPPHNLREISAAMIYISTIMMILKYLREDLMRLVQDRYSDWRCDSWKRRIMQANSTGRGRIVCADARKLKKTVRTVCIIITEILKDNKTTLIDESLNWYVKASWILYQISR